MKNLIAVMMTAFILGACSEMKSPIDSMDASSQSSTGISLASSAQMGERVVISSSRASEIIAYNWHIRNDLGIDVTSRCAPSRTSATLECFFYEVGKVTVYLEASLRKGTTTVIKNEIEISDSPFGMDQPPTVIAKLTQGASVVLLSNILGSMDDVPQFYRNQSIAFDLTESSDDKPGALNYRVAIAGMAPAVYNAATFNHSFAQIGTYGVTVEVTDSAGNTARKVFNLLVTCDASAPRPVVSNISASYQGIGNFWNYTVAHTGGAGPFVYQWDFNGDNMFDTDWQSAPTVNTDKLTTYRGNRLVSVMVKDNSCNFVALYRQSVNFNAMPKLTPVVVGTTDASTFTNNWTRHYIQTELTPAANNPNLIGLSDEDSFGPADFIAMKEIPRIVPNIANCEYSPTNGTAIMRGLNYYTTPSREGVRHGVAIEMTDLPKNPAINQLLSSSNGKMSEARVYGDRQPDSQSQILYKKTQQACQLQFNVMRLPDGSVPCTGGSAVVSRVYRIYGTFQCPELEASNGSELSLEKGAFACEHAIADACVGGGGGGGGIVPITQ